MPFSALKSPAKKTQITWVFFWQPVRANRVTMSLSAKDKLAVKTFFDKVAPKAEEIGNETLSRYCEMSVRKYL